MQRQGGIAVEARISMYSCTPPTLLHPVQIFNGKLCFGLLRLIFSIYLMRS
jgi:hypothetical protein